MTLQGLISKATDRRGNSNLDEITNVGSRMAFDVVDLAGFLDETGVKARNQLVQMADLRTQAELIQTANASVQEAIAESTTSSRETLSKLNETLQTIRASNQKNEDIARWVASISKRMQNIETALHGVEKLNTEISGIARQVNILAINAKIEAVRAGQSGRGFAVVAEAITELSRSTTRAAADVTDGIASLAEDLRSFGAEARGVASEAKVVIQSFGGTNTLMDGIAQQMHGTVAKGEEMQHRAESISTAVSTFMPVIEALENASQDTSDGVERSRERIHNLVDDSERVVKLGIASGGVTEDQKFISFVTSAAKEISNAFTQAVERGDIAMSDLFDRNYVPIQGSNPEQYLTRFTAFTDRLLPKFQEPALNLDPRIVFCAAVDQNGYLPTHNHKFARPQSPDPIWNAANARNRRMFNDRVGLKAGQNRDQFLMQVYRRDMGGGNFALMKDLSAPIIVKGKLWGGLRLAYII